jgi:hypothetical protein
MIRQNLLAAFLFGILALLQASSLGAQQTGQVTVVSTTATTVWPYSPTCGAGQDYSDVPVRPFLVEPGPTVLWFAANSSGSYASVGTGTGPDILASFQRGTAAGGSGCVSWLPPANYTNSTGSTPASYNSGLWLVAPFTPDGTNIRALVHNEFHGEWTNSFIWCWTQMPGIYLPCNYWNIVSASSSNAGQTFTLLQQSGTSNTNRPAIVLGQPYQAPPESSPANVPPYGITAQSNILQVGQYYYVLAQQLPYVGLGVPAAQSGICIYRAAVPTSAGTPLTWIGWNGYGYNVPVAGSYPVGGQMPLCWPVLGQPFRFSWSFNVVLNQFVIIGQDTLAALKQKGISTTDCPLAPNVSPTSGTPDSAFVYMTATLDDRGRLTPRRAETCLLQINSITNWQSSRQSSTPITGQAYPSLLDPTSPQIAPGDFNFQRSGARPWLYFTQLNPYGAQNRNGYDRDVVRLPLAVTVSTGTTSR